MHMEAHVDVLCTSLKQRMGMLARIKGKVSKEKLLMISEAIFMSKIRYGLAVYAKPKYEFSHLEQPMDPNIARLQVVHNDLLRLIEGKTRKNHINMQTLRENSKIMSINQLSCYHVAMEMYNIINHSSSDLLKEEFSLVQGRYELRCLEEGKVKVPERGKKNCTGFGHVGPRLWNHLPGHIRKTTIRGIFKGKIKQWIWDEIPSV